jgi:hypothetical protein
MLKPVVALVPDFLVIFSVQVAVYAKILVQLQVAPMVHGVANRHFQRGDKLFKTLNAALIARDIRLGRAIRAHDAPLVVVAEIGAVRVPAAQPNLRQVVKAAVLVYFLRGDVAVVVYQRHFRGIVVVKVLCSFGFQQEILVHKFFHCLSGLYALHTPFVLLRLYSK